MGIKEANFTDSVDVRSGIITKVTDGSSGVALFVDNPFANPPRVVLTLRGTSSAVDIPILVVVSQVGFSWKLHKGHGGASHTWDIYWIATDAGIL